jgi:transketolase
MAHDNLMERFGSFGWHVISADGHDYEALKQAFEEAKEAKGKPTIIIANTIKGYGSPVMEHKVNWHHRVPTKEELAQIMKDLEEKREVALHE